MKRNLFTKLRSRLPGGDEGVTTLEVVVIAVVLLGLALSVAAAIKAYVDNQLPGLAG